MDLVICIIYIVTGGIWICKNIKLDSIVSPTNWRIMFIKLLMLFMIPLALYIFFYFLNAPLGLLFGIALKSNQKTLARCSPNKRSFHYDLVIYLTSFVHIRMTHFGSNRLITSKWGVSYHASGGVR